MKRLIRFLFRTLMILLLVGGMAGALVWSFWPQPLEVELSTIGRGPLRVTVDDDGRTRIRERYVVSAPLAGRLLRIDLDPGDAVYNATTLLATIEPSAPQILTAREVAQAEARVHASEAALAKAAAAVERARAEWEYAESEMGRLRPLVAARAASPREAEEAEMQYRAREQDLRAASFAQEVAQFEVQMARAALLHAQPGSDPASDRRFPIRSPIDGQVLRVLQKSEAVVQVGTPLLELGDPTDLEIEVDVLSVDAVKIARGSRAILEQWGGDQPLRAVVRRVEPAAFTKISALGVEEQRVNVILDLDEPPDRSRTLGDAYRVEARIVIWEQDDVLQVPTGALFRHRDQWAVFLMAEGRAVLRTVEIGQRTSLAARVLGGLDEGDRVVLFPSDQVADGSRIAPRR
jgi:HlyD family secretion protein